MKEEFSKFMIDKNFKNAAELIFNATLNIKVPENVNVNINIDREKNISDLTKQMESCYNQINDTYSEVSFEKMWKAVFAKPEFSEKHSLRSDEIVLSKAQNTYDNLMNGIKMQQYQQIFQTTTLTLNATLQGLIEAAVKIK